MRTCEMQKEWLFPAKCLSGSLLLTLVKPQLAGPGLYLLAEQVVEKNCSLNDSFKPGKL